MKLPAPVEYHLGLDYIREAFQTEQAIIAPTVSESHEGRLLPFDGGFRAGMEAYKQRAVTTIVYPGVVVLRAMGIHVG